MCVTASFFVGCTKLSKSGSLFTEYEKSLISSADFYKLPSEKEVRSRLKEIYENKNEIFLSGKTFQRLAYPKMGDKIKINFTFDCSENIKDIFHQCIKQYNDIFSVINPNYQFEANFNPSEQDLLNPFYINVELQESTEQTLGNTNSTVVDINQNYGEELLKNTIKINELLFKYDQNPIIINAFLHEFGHILGFADAYLNENATKDTIMQIADLYCSKLSLSEIDIATLDALYRDPETKLSNEEIEDFIKTYPEISKEETKFVLFVEQIKNIDADALKNILFRSKYSNEEKRDFLLKPDESLNTNPEFSKDFPKYFDILGIENSSYYTDEESGIVYIANKFYINVDDYIFGFEIKDFIDFEFTKSDGTTVVQKIEVTPELNKKEISVYKIPEKLNENSIEKDFSK